MPGWIYRTEAHRIAAATVGAVLSTGVAFAAMDGEVATPPDVIVIVLDTLRADHVGSYGAGPRATPELDVFARDGVRFARVLAPSSWTRSSTAAMLTGRSPRSLGVYEPGADVLPGAATTLAEAFHKAGYRTVGATANPNINSLWRFHQGFDRYTDSDVVFDWMPAGEGQKRHGDEVPLPTADRVFSSLLEGLDEAGDRPVYLQACIMEVHEHWKLDASDLREPFRGKEWGAYAQAAADASQAVGRFMNELVRRRGARPRIVVVTSDHGEGLGDHPSVEDSTAHGYVLYESNLEVPLLIYGPALEKLRPRVVEDEVSLLDLAPTLLSLVGLEVPSAVQGVDLTPLLEGRSIPALADRLHFVETRFIRANKVAIYDRSHAWIQSRDDWKGVDREELQARGTAADGTKTNRAEAEPETAARLSRALQEWERDHPGRKAQRINPPRDAAGWGQLRALGYVD